MHAVRLTRQHLKLAHLKDQPNLFLANEVIEPVCIHIVVHFL